MFRNIRLRFIVIASATITCILFTMVGVLNSARFFQTNNEIQSVLTILSDNGGKFPSLEETAEQLNNDHISIDTISQFRYFSFVLNADQSAYSADLANISNLSEQDALRYARRIARLKRNIGLLKVGQQYYSYQLTYLKKSNRVLVVFLDSTNYIDDRNEFLGLSIQLSLYSLLFFVVIVSVFSGLAIRPYIRNYEKQKRFITNAGHELKTPLAIISANTELQELMTGENEWTESTKEQVERLSNLINQLISLARTEEQPDITLVDVDFSATVTRVASNFKSVIEKAGKDYQIQVQEGIHVKATADELYELVSILIDNACKYCDDGGQISVSLSKSKHRRRSVLLVSNTYAAGESVDYSRFFDRFYREDESHNSQKQAGYGIGLSMAETLVGLFKGKISVFYKNGSIHFRILL